MINWTDPALLTNLNDVGEKMLHEWLKDVLVNFPLTVTFTKVDGTLRVMKCTLEESKIPKVEIKENAKPRKVSDSTKALRVFDLDKNEWRSFTIKNITKIEFCTGEKDGKV